MSGPDFIIDADALDTYLNVPNSAPAGVDSALAHEAVITLAEDGLRLAVRDPANVAMIPQCHLSTDAFESYSVSQEWDMGLNLERLRDILDIADDLVHVSLNGEKRKLTIEAGHRSVTMALIDPKSIRDPGDDPDLDLPNRATVEASDLTDALEVTDLVGDTVYIEVDPESQTLQFRAEGDTDSSDLTLAADDCIHLEANEQTEAIFSHDYLNMLFDPIPDAAEVTLSLGDELPVRSTWQALDGNLTVSQMSAPRIQSN